MSDLSKQEVPHRAGLARQPAVQDVIRWHTAQDAERFRALGWWGEQCAFELADHWAEVDGDKLAVADGTREWTYSDLRHQSLRAAQVLADLGVRPGDAVAAQVPNSALIPALHFAVNRLGAIFIPIPQMWRAAEVGPVVQASRASVLLVPDSADFDHLAMARALQADLPQLRLVLRLTGSAGDSFFERAETAKPDIGQIASFRPSPDDVLSVICSSGTTGVPKVSAFSNNNMLTNAAHIATSIRLGREDVMAAIAPANTGSTGYVYGVFAALMLGATSHILERWSPRAAVGLLADRRCTAAVAIPTQIVMLLDADAGGHDYSALRVFLNAGAPLAPATAAAAERRMETAVIGIYGASESAIPTALGLDDPPGKRRSTVGRLALGQQMRLVDDKGADVPAGQPGEVIWRGPNNSFGFLNQPELDRLAWDDEGYFHSGDLGVLDEDGYLRIVGRLKDMILRGGHNIFPAEVESVLFENPRIREVAVVGIPDERLGERPCAVLVLMDEKDSMGVREVSEFLRDAGLSKFKFPEFVITVESLPRAASAKLDRASIVATAVSVLNQRRL